MPGTMFGADAEELERIAAELEGYEQEMDYLLVQGVGAVSLVGLSATLGTIWRGPRSDEFGAIWQRRHLLRLREVQGLLREAAQDLRKNAGEQRSASSILGPLPGLSRPAIGGGSPTLPIGPWLGTGFNRGHAPWRTIASWDDFTEAWTKFDWSVGSLGSIGDLRIDGADHITDVFLHPQRWHGGFPGGTSMFAQEAFEHGKHFKNFGTVVGGISVGIDTFQATDAWMNDGFTAGTVWKTVEAGWGAAGMVYPPIGWTKMAFDGGVMVGDALYDYTPLGDYLEYSHPATASIDKAMDLGVQADQMVSAGQFDEAHELNRQAMEAAEEARRQSEGARGLFNATKTVFTFGLL